MRSQAPLLLLTPQPLKFCTVNQALHDLTGYGLQDLQQQFFVATGHC